MNYQESKVYLDELFQYGSVLGLENMRQLLKRLGDPQDTMQFIHIAGTNGKGSVLAYLSAVLTGAGYRTGCYISPHMATYRERVQVDGEMIGREDVARLLTRIRAAAQQMQDDGVGRPSYFEVGTALAFLYFKEKGCRIAILETGLGGRLDATNVVTTTILEVMASISMDHMDYLGDTLAEIAGEKAGIIKPGTVVVSARQEPDADQVIRRVCRERDCHLRVVDEDQISHITYGCPEQRFTYQSWKDVHISLAGGYQMKNASLALEAVEALGALGYPVPREKVYEGMARARWWGRFTPVAQDPTVILDGAHNVGAAQELRRSLELYFPGKNIYYIMGILKDKEYDKVIALTAPLARHIITVETPHNPRALPAQDLRDAVAQVNPSVEAADSIPAAIHTLYQRVGREDVIVIFGSLSYLWDAEKSVREEVSHHG